jgi:hypothetical protein
LEYSRDFEGYNWEEIAKKIGVSFKIKKKTNRTPGQCLRRFQRSLNDKILKSKW